MKSLLFLLVSFFLCMSACISINKNKLINVQRDELDKEEQWRYQLPINETKPQKPIFPEVIKKELGNGLNVFVLPDHNLPIATITITFKSGSRFDKKNKAGTFVLLGLMLKESTKNLSSLELAESFANLGSELSVNTYLDKIIISADVMSQNITQVIDLITDIVQNPAFLEEDFSRVRLTLINNLQSMQAMPSYMARKEFSKAIYGNEHPYSNSIINNPKDLELISINDLKSAHAEHFGANNAALIAVGDVDFAILKKSAQKLFTWSKKVNDLQIIKEPISQKSMQTILIPQAKTPQTYLFVGQLGPNINNEKSRAAVDILQTIAASMPTSRLGANLREGKGWTYGVQSEFTPLLSRSIFAFNTSIQVPYGVDALREMQKEFENLQTIMVTQEELSSAKNSVLMSFNSLYESLYSSSLSISNKFVYGKDLNYESKYYDEINAITPADVMQAAKEYLAKDNMVVVAVGDTEVMSVPLKKMNIPYRIKQ
jgi:zinc protease